MLEHLLRQLNSRRKSVREQALAEARRLSPEQLLELAELEAKSYQQQKRINHRIGWCVVIAMLTLVAVSWRGDFNPRWIFMLQYSGWLLVLLLPKRARRSVAQLIEQTEDMRFLLPTLSLLAQNEGDENVTKSLCIALKRMLPQMRADQMNSLTLQQRQALLIPLQKPYENTELTLAILKALEQVGDETAISIVEKIVSEEPYLWTGYPERFVVNGRTYYSSNGEIRQLFLQVRQAAHDCLPYLRESAQRVQQSQTLLRASDATMTPDVLLRPASAQENSTAPEQLLRSASQEDMIENVAGK